MLKDQFPSLHFIPTDTVNLVLWQQQGVWVTKMIDTALKLDADHTTSQEESKIVKGSQKVSKVIDIYWFVKPGCIIENLDDFGILFFSHACHEP